MGNDVLQVAVLGGGRSAEHDISRLSAVSVIDVLELADGVHPVPILVDRDGSWQHVSRDEMMIDGDPEPGQTQHGRITSSDTGSIQELLSGIDCVFALLHGEYGEDGRLQGMLESLGVPYIGPDTAASAVCMDKALTKTVLAAAELPVADGVTVDAAGGVDAATATVTAALVFPVFVKPARLGSSVGISRATDASSLRDALIEAFDHDPKVVVEAELVGREVEVGVLGNDELTVSPPGEIDHDGAEGWYDFTAKYGDGDSRVVIPAELDETTTQRVRDIAGRAYRAAGCSGLSRVDVFVTDDGRVVVNEINTLPGFTRHSAYPLLLAAAGIAYDALLVKLIELGIEAHRTRSRQSV